MSVKERKKRGHFPGGLSDIAGVDFINAVREQDRDRSRRNGNGHVPSHDFYSDITLVQRITPDDLESQIEFETLDRVQSSLVDAVRKQASHNHSKYEQEIARSVTTREVFRAYKKTPQYYSRLNFLRQQQRHGVAVGEASRPFAGKVFEDIAYSCFSPQIKNGVLIAPGITEELFLELFRGESHVDHEYDSRTIDGISVPDGVVITLVEGKPILVGYVEYSLAQNNEKYRTQFASYQRSIDEIRHKSSQSVCPREEFVVDFVVPRPERGREYPVLSGSVQGTFHYLPFDAVNFGIQVNNILAEEYKRSFSERVRPRL